jgi:hypothetical protein
MDFIVAFGFVGAVILAYWRGWSDAKKQHEAERAFDRLEAPITKAKDPQ